MLVSRLRREFETNVELYVEVRGRLLQFYKYT